MMTILTCIVQRSLTVLYMTDLKDKMSIIIMVYVLYDHLGVV
jgi:hypothetical protein